MLVLLPLLQYNSFSEGRESLTPLCIISNTGLVWSRSFSEMNVLSLSRIFACEVLILCIGRKTWEEQFRNFYKGVGRDLFVPSK